MPTDLDGQMAPVGVEDVKRVVVDIGHRLLSLDGVLRADIPHRRKSVDSSLERNGFELSVPRRESNESHSGTGTITEATKVRLEAVAYLPGTDGSNPFPSSVESIANLTFGGHPLPAEPHRRTRLDFSASGLPGAFWLL